MSPSLVRLPSATARGTEGARPDDTRGDAFAEADRRPPAHSREVGGRDDGRTAGDNAGAIALIFGRSGRRETKQARKGRLPSRRGGDAWASPSFGRASLRKIT